MEKQHLILFKNAGSSTILYLNCFEPPNLVYFGRGAASRAGLFFEVLHYTEKRKYYNPFTEANPIIRYVSPLYSIVYVVANVLFFR